MHPPPATADDNPDVVPISNGYFNLILMLISSATINEWHYYLNKD